MSISENDRKLITEVALIISEEMAEWRGDPWHLAEVLFQEGLLGEY